MSSVPVVFLNFNGRFSALFIVLEISMLEWTQLWYSNYIFMMEYDGMGFEARVA